MRAANLALKFGLELAAIAAFAYWGATVAGGALAIVLGIAAPLIAIGLWGRFAAPRATRRLGTGTRVPFELSVFALAVLALLSSSTVIAIAFGSLVLINAACLTAFGQWAE